MCILCDHNKVQFYNFPTISIKQNYATINSHIHTAILSGDNCLFNDNTYTNTYVHGAVNKLLILLVLAKL